MKNKLKNNYEVQFLTNSIFNNDIKKNSTKKHKNFE